MKKYLLIIVTILSVVLIGKVSAANIQDEEPKVLTLDASMDGTKITAKGTTSETMLAVTVLVYDETGKTFIKMASGQVDDAKYEVSIDGFEDGKKYIVRVSNYDGGDFLEQLVPDEEKTPDTSDNVYSYIIIGTISVISLLGITIYRKRLN